MYFYYREKYPSWYNKYFTQIGQLNGITHETINNSVNFVDPETGAKYPKNREVMEVIIGT